MQVARIAESQAGDLSSSCCTEQRGKRDTQRAGGGRGWAEGLLSLCVPSVEGAYFPSGLLDLGGGPCPLPKRSPTIRSSSALPVVAQPTGGSAAVGHPGEPGGETLGGGASG